MKTVESFLDNKLPRETRRPRVGDSPVAPIRLNKPH